MNDLNPNTNLSTNAVATGRDGWWRALWSAASAGPTSPVLLAMAGPNGAPLWPGASRVLTDGLSSRTVSDLCVDEDPTVDATESTGALTADDLCRAA